MRYARKCNSTWSLHIRLIECLAKISCWQSHFRQIKHCSKTRYAALNENINIFAFEGITPTNDCQNNGFDCHGYSEIRTIRIQSSPICISLCGRLAHDNGNHNTFFKCALIHTCLPRWKLIRTKFPTAYTNTFIECFN